MKPIRTLVILLLMGGSLGSSVQAQQWVEDLFDPSVNFYTVQDAAEAYFDSIPIDQRKGTGWKQYKRWEYYTQQRIEVDGTRRQPGTVLRERLEYLSQNGSSRGYGNANWQEIGPITVPLNGTGQPNGNGRLNCIAFHPTDANTLYVGAPSGGVWKTTDGGTSWSLLDNGLVRLGVSSIVIHPTNPNIIYIGTGDRDANDSPGLGVWRSTDAGVTWAPHNNGMGNRTVYEILMHPSNSNILIASTQGRIYRSTDAGANWVIVHTGDNCKDLAMHPSNPNILYAVDNNFFRSTDNGQTWTNITTMPAGGNRWCVATSAAAPNYVYILAGGGTGLVGIYRSTDAGLNFSTQATGPNILGYATNGSDNASQSWYDLVLKADPNNANVLYAGGINIWKSSDAGANWSCVAHWLGSGSAAAVHADQHTFEHNPLNDRWYFGHDGGLHYSTDDGITYTDITDGMAIAQVYKIGVAQTVENRVINGYQDNGTAIYYDGTWRTEIGGDGMECIIDPTDENYLYGALYYGDIRRSSDGGTTFAPIAANGTNGITETGAWVTPYKLHPSNTNIMYVGYKNVWRADNVRTGAAGSINWVQISSFANSSTCRDIAVAPSNGDVVYVSRNNSTDRFLRSNNASTATPSWTDLTANLPLGTNQNIWDIEIHPSDPSTLWIAYQNNRVYKSTNAGLNWTDVSSGLPNLDVNTLVFDSRNPAIEALYAAQDVGIFYRDNTTGGWIAYDAGFPAVEVTELEIRQSPGDCKSKLYAATYGRGTWSSDLYDPGTEAPTACFESSTQQVCMGQVITLSDQSDFSPTSYSWSISPNTFSYEGGTNANDANPQVSFNAAGVYDITLNCSNGYGSDVESKVSYITVSSTSLPTSLDEDFEGSSNCATTSNCGTTTCTLSSLWTNVSNGIEDDIDWRTDEGGTPSSSTGPSLDLTEGTSTGNYLYLEASSCSGQVALLESSCMQMNDDYTFEFGYHMFGTNMGSLHLDINDGSGWVEDIIPPTQGDQGSSWQTAQVDLSAYNGQDIRLRLRGITGIGFQSDIALDGFSFSPPITLPTELLSFEAKCRDGLIDLQWLVAENDLNESFKLQRFTLSQEWEDLQEIPVTESTEYRFTDASAAIQASNYYRLAIKQADGSESYSDIIEASCNYPTNRVKVFPNPFKESVTLQFAAAEASNSELRVLDALGQLVLQQQISVNMGYNSHEIDLAELPQGIYFLQLDERSFSIQKQE